MNLLELWLEGLQIILFDFCIIGGFYLLTLVLCHLVGDYFLQSDFIAKTKGQNLYHLLVHCSLYCVPFLFMYNLYSWSILYLFVTHCIIDLLKARYNKISYFEDQLLHYFVFVPLVLINN